MFGADLQQLQNAGFFHLQFLETYFRLFRVSECSRRPLERLSRGTRVNGSLLALRPPAHFYAPTTGGSQQQLMRHFISKSPIMAELQPRREAEPQLVNGGEPDEEREDADADAPESAKKRRRKKKRSRTSAAGEREEGHERSHPPATTVTREWCGTGDFFFQPAREGFFFFLRGAGRGSTRPNSGAAGPAAAGAPGRSRCQELNSTAKTDEKLSNKGTGRWVRGWRGSGRGGGRLVWSLTCNFNPD